MAKDPWRRKGRGAKETHPWALGLHHDSPPFCGSFLRSWRLRAKAADKEESRAPGPPGSPLPEFRASGSQGIPDLLQCQEEPQRVSWNLPAFCDSTARPPARPPGAEAAVLGGTRRCVVTVTPAAAAAITAVTLHSPRGALVRDLSQGSQRLCNTHPYSHFTGEETETQESSSTRPDSQRWVPRFSGSRPGLFIVTA